MAEVEELIADYPSLVKVFTSTDSKWFYTDEGSRWALYLFNPSVPDRFMKCVVKKGSADDADFAAKHKDVSAIFKDKQQEIWNECATIVLSSPPSFASDGFEKYPLSAEVFFRKSFKYSITAGVTTDKHEKFSVDTWIRSGYYEVIGTPHADDYIEFLITDQDNVLGQGAGFEVAKYVETEYINPGVKSVLIEPRSARLVPKELYYTTRYVSAGASSDNDLTIITRLEMRSRVGNK